MTGRRGTEVGSFPPIDGDQWGHSARIYEVTPHTSPSKSSTNNPPYKVGEGSGLPSSGSIPRSPGSACNTPPAVRSLSHQHGRRACAHHTRSVLWVAKAGPSSPAAIFVLERDSFLPEVLYQQVGRRSRALRQPSLLWESSYDLP